MLGDLVRSHESGLEGGDERLRISIRAILIVTLVIALILGVLIELNRRLENYVLNPYRLQSTGDILIEYMEEHNRWPSDWDELQRFVESNGNNLFGVRTFRELRENISVEFDFDPATINLSVENEVDEPQLRVVVATDGGYHGSTHDPNTTIFRYLVRKQDRKD